MQWLAEICVHRPVFATVIVLFLTVVGGFSFFTLGVDRFPKIDLPTISVRTSNPGAAPEEVETEITDVIEGALNTVPGVEEMRSSSSRGSSNVTLTFNLEKDPDVAFQEVQQKLSTITFRLPETADPPVAQKSDPDSQPILMYTISAPRGIMELTEQVENLIQERIESADGVGEVFMWGARNPQVLVSVNPDRLRAYNIPVTDVTAAIRSQNQEMPGGNIVEGRRTLGVRTMSKLGSVEEFNDVVIATRNGFPIQIRDIGSVQLTGAEPSSAASLDGVTSVSVGIRKQAGANTIAVIRNVKERMANIMPTLPDDMKVAVIRDQSEFIENSLHAIEEHLILGGIFAAVVVFLFLWNFRSTLISAFAIPVSIIAAFAAIAAFGYSLNQMTMLALTLMVGIVIDDAIVVLENIYRYVEEKGMDPFRAAVEGTREIGLAVLATTLSLLAVFIPVGFMQGIVGRFMSSFGLTAAAAIAVSLIVSFTLTPMLAARWIKRPKKDAPARFDEGVTADGQLPEAAEKGHASDSKDGWFYRKIDGTYTWLLRLAMRYRWAVVLICIATVASIVPLYKFVGMAFLPDEDESLFQVNVRGPQGTSLSATQSMLDRIARDIRAEVPGVKNTLILAGFGRGSGSNNGFINVSLFPVAERKKSQSDLINQTRQIARKYASKDYQVTVSASSSIAGSIGLGRGGSGVAMYIAGPDMEKLTEYANTMVEKMKEDPIYRDPDTSIEVGNPEIRVTIDRTKAADLGVRAGDVAQALNILSAGQIVSTYSENSEQYDVVVRAEESYRRDRNNFNYFTVTSSNRPAAAAGQTAKPGQSAGATGIVELSRVIKIDEGTAPSSISRLNRQRQVTVSAGLPPNASESDAVAKMQKIAGDLNMPAGYVTGVTGQSKELQKAYSAFLYAFLLSFVFMYLILAAQFESFIHPVTILLTLPLAIPFALLSTAIA
ncbi:MAG: efflux RND transporter permease subunit, partial [Acidobacteria bacterium]|nr:efflux RND transporter permease subunit [Acidobacteriota bacterium]